MLTKKQTDRQTNGDENSITQKVLEVTKFETETVCGDCVHDMLPVSART